MSFVIKKVFVFVFLFLFIFPPEAHLPSRKQTRLVIARRLISSAPSMLDQPSHLIYVGMPLTFCREKPACL